MTDLKEFIHYSDIILETFVFTHITLPQEFCNKIWSLNLPDTGIKDGEVRFKLKDASGELKDCILEILNKIPVDGVISEFIKHFTFDVNKMSQGEYVPMHNEVSQKSPVEVLLWLTKTEDFEGRDFIIDKNGETKKVKPYNGLVCFVDTTNPFAFHGVSELTSNTEIITIVGGLGRKDGYTSKKN